MKRITPSFTVEFRHGKRSKSGSARFNWADGQIDSPPLITESVRAAASVFRQAESPPAESAPSPPVRILPSLTEPDTLTAPRMAQTGAARKARARLEPRTARSDEAKLADFPGPPRDAGLSADSSEKPVQVTGDRDAQPGKKGPPSERIVKSRQTARKGEAAKPRERPSRTLDRREGLDRASNVNRGAQDVAKPSPASAVSPTAPGIRRARLLSRYVLRDDLGPSEGWKRRIRAQRDRRR